MDRNERYEAYLSYLYDVAQHHYRDCPEIDALVQETMVTLLVKEQHGETIDYPKGFLSTVLRNKYNDWLRQKYKNRVVSFGELPELSAEEQDEDPQEEYAAVRREIGRLIAIYREVAVRYYMHGHSVERIAADLHIPKGTVLSRLSQARQQLKERMGPMQMYSSISYEPKGVALGIWGSASVNNEPFSLLSSKIEQNLLVLAYEKPVSLADVAQTMGIPCAYLEPIAERLVAGELLGRTPSGLVYTRCFLRSYADSFGDIAAQEALAKRRAAEVMNAANTSLAPLQASAAFVDMSEKQQKTLILFILHEALQRAVWDMRPSYEGAPTTPPERPHGGRWLASGVVFEAGEGRHSPYDRSGPVQVSYRAALEGEADCQMYDLQSCFGDAHWRYPQLSYPCSLQSVLRLYASTVSNRVTVDSTAVYDLIPELEQMYILRRDDTGKVRLNIPALTYDDHERLVIPAIERLREALLPLLEKDVQALWSASHYRVPKHVDACEWFKRFDALNAYTIAQMRAIVEQELLPYEVILGETPLIYVVYRP